MSIKSPLQALKQVQDLDRAWYELAARKRARKEALAAKEANLKREEVALAKLRDRANQLQRTIRETEQQADDAKRKVGELKSKRDNSSSARMLKAIETELEASEQAQESAETTALETMEALDEVQSQAQDLAAELESHQADFKVRQEKLADELAQLDAEAATNRDQRESWFEQVPEGTREQFTRLASRYPKDALTSVADGGICDGCSTKLPPDVLRRVRNMQEWVSCPSCGRLLHDPVAVSAD